jgi:hypothetical protein
MSHTSGSKNATSALALLFVFLFPGNGVFGQQPPDAADGGSPAQVTPVTENAALPKSGSSESTTPATEQPAPDSATRKETKAPEVPFSSRPYKVTVTIGFDGSQTQFPAVRERLVEEIRRGLDRLYGPMWNAQVAASDWLIPASRNRLQRLTETDLLTRYPESTAEKVILIAVSGSHGVFEVSCREYDTRVQELSPMLSEQSGDFESVANIACRLARDSFRPVLLLAGPAINKTELEFFLQAGTIIPPDPSAAQIAEGDVLRTFLRQMDRRNPDQLKLLQRLDLCYVRVTSFNQELHTQELSPGDTDVVIEGKTADASETYVDSGHVRGILISHGLVPFGGRGRSMQQIALRQRPSASSSRVRLVLQSRPDRPLICYRVDKVAKLRHTDVSETPNVRILTDRNGAIEIAVDPQNPTFWLYVYSGSLLLARVPYAPGLIPEDIMKLPDDGLRLGVEGELYLLRDQLVDMVAQKAVFMSLAKKGAAAGDVPSVEAAIAQLDALPGPKDFDAMLNQIRTPALRKAEQQKNPGVKRKIEVLCEKMSESLTTFFATDKRLKEAEELKKLRQSAESGSFRALPPSTPPSQ